MQRLSPRTIFNQASAAGASQGRIKIMGAGASAAGVEETERPAAEDVDGADS